MIHVLFDRPTGELKAFEEDGSIVFGPVAAGGDAWGDPSLDPWGFECPTPPGHYLLSAVEWFPSPIASEGAGQIYVADFDGEHADALEDIGVAKRGLQVAGIYGLVVGGIDLPLGELLAHNRSAIMIHGGGSNAPFPLANFQPLLKTDGCTRMHNADWKDFARRVSSWRAGNTVVYSVVGAPLTLPD